MSPVELTSGSYCGTGAPLKEVLPASWVLGVRAWPLPVLEDMDSGGEAVGDDSDDDDDASKLPPIEEPSGAWAPLLVPEKIVVCVGR
mgnify:CR=1 FL=1